MLKKGFGFMTLVIGLSFGFIDVYGMERINWMYRDIKKTEEFINELQKELRPCETAKNAFFKKHTGATSHYDQFEARGKYDADERELTQNINHSNDLHYRISNLQKILTEDLSDLKNSITAELKTLNIALDECKTEIAKYQAWKEDIKKSFSDKDDQIRFTGYYDLSIESLKEDITKIDAQITDLNKLLHECQTKVTVLEK